MLPPALPDIEIATKALGFTMASDRLTGFLLRTLAASKPAGALLELGTGTGIGTAWILDGMDPTSTLISVDNDARASAVARRYLGHDPRLKLHVQDGAALMASLNESGARFDFIFADTWPGKFTHLDDALSLLATGGLYVVDDLLPTPNWPPDHPPKVADFVTTLEGRPDLVLTRLDWATGILVAAKASRAAE